MWVGLSWTYVMDWVELNFFLPIMVDWIKKFPQSDLIRPMNTPRQGKRTKWEKKKQMWTIITDSISVDPTQSLPQGPKLNNVDESQKIILTQIQRALMAQLIFRLL